MGLVQPAAANALNPSAQTNRRPSRTILFMRTCSQCLIEECDSRLLSNRLAKWENFNDCRDAAGIIRARTFGGDFGSRRLLFRRLRTLEKIGTRGHNVPIKERI